MGRRSRGGALAVLVILLANVLTLAAAPEEVQPDREGAGGARWAEDDEKRASGDDARGARCCGCDRQVSNGEVGA